MPSRGLTRLHRLLVTVVLTILLFTSCAHCEDDDAQKPIASPPSPRRHPDLPVLGYVTPWHPQGTEITEKHRHKFDMICPVWYTVHAVRDGYEFRGGPPSNTQDQWYKRLQQPSLSADGDELKPIKIVPRFFLDGWSEIDFRNLVFNETRWHLLSDVVMAVVDEKGFDGIVFESAATHLLHTVLTPLTDALHHDDKLLIIVSQPIRPHGPVSDSPEGQLAAAIQDANNMLLVALPQLALLADFFSIMTYDLHGFNGRDFNMEDVVPGSRVEEAARTGKLREPGPNTSADWVRENLISFVEATDPVYLNEHHYQVERQHEFNLALQQASRKFLMGAPLYGYKYPFLCIDKTSATLTEATPVASGPHAAIMTGVNAPKIRINIPEGAVPILRAVGETITARDIAETMKKHNPEVQKSEPDGEYYFDYEPNVGDGYWRVFMPTEESLGHVLETIKGVTEDDLTYTFGGAGVALWEVGQSTDELLNSL